MWGGSWPGLGRPGGIGCPKCGLRGGGSDSLRLGGWGTGQEASAATDDSPGGPAAVKGPHAGSRWRGADGALHTGPHSSTVAPDPNRATAPASPSLPPQYQTDRQLLLTP